ncbi:MAG: PepSY domain-containing protein [Hyphomicrobiaceae bacterium]|nr:PepSY domain-containing protein [Hyphomicrobiaceae bacterium]
MKRYGFRNLVIALVGAAAFLTAALYVAAYADDDDDNDHFKPHDHARELMLQKRIMPLETLQAQVLSQFAGRLIDLKLDEDDGQLVYEFKVLTERGRVLEIKIDARTGTVLKVEDDD